MSARDELAELIAKAIEDTYHGFASACGDEVTISVTMQGEDSVSVDCDKVADAILAAGWVQLRQCDHQWMTTFGASHPDAGPPWRECSSCGRTEDLTA